eukprot:1391895-Pleurochrysis_carterae.AAC.1
MSSEHQHTCLPDQRLTRRRRPVPAFQPFLFHTTPCHMLPMHRSTPSVDPSPRPCPASASVSTSAPPLPSHLHPCLRPAPQCSPHA